VADANISTAGRDSAGCSWAAAYRPRLCAGSPAMHLPGALTAAVAPAATAAAAPISAAITPTIAPARGKRGRRGGEKGREREHDRAMPCHTFLHRDRQHGAVRR